MNSILSRLSASWPTILTIVVLAIALLVASRTKDSWTPYANYLLRGEPLPENKSGDEEDAEAHEHGDIQTVELSQAGLKNIDFEPFRVELGSFERTITIPAAVVEQPGRSQRIVSAHLTGIVTSIVPWEGAAIEPGSPMFEIHLTHEELVSTQRELLETSESLAVIESEIARLRAVTEGVLAGNRILEQEYERQKLEVKFTAQKQSLKLHGLGDDDVARILATGEMVDSLIVYAPQIDLNSPCEIEHLLHVQSLPVTLGQHVEAGETLAVVADHCSLMIEGRAFEDDAELLRNAVRDETILKARFTTTTSDDEIVEGLQILYLADHVDDISRAFHFYLELPNHVVLERHAESGQRFVTWRFTTGQRLELLLPVEVWEDQIVVPIDAIVDEGAETYVYQENGKHFDQVPVHVQFRDRDWAVIANDGSIWPGATIAGQGAYQMHLLLKNQASGGVDAHAGHTH